MKKILIALMLTTTTQTNNPKKEITTKDELNQAVLDGFFNNDTINKSKTIYLIK